MNRVQSGILLFAFTGLLACGKKAAPPTPPTAVNLITASARTVLYYDKYPSTTVALSQVNLNAQITGYITGIYFTEGTHVYKGQKLYSIDDRLYEASVIQAKANLRVDSGNMQQVQQDADRYIYLKKYNAIASQEVDHALINLKNAKDSIQAAQQQLRTAQTNLSYATIYAPFDGTIGISQVRLGNLVTPGTTVLNTISTDNPMAVDFLINEAQLPHFQDLQRSKQGTIDSLFTILLPNQQVYPFTGKISVIDRAVDPQTGSIMIRLVFPNPQNTLRAGMSTVVRVHNQEATPQIVVPSRAVVEQMGEYFLFIAKDSIYHGGGGAGTPGADGAGGGQAGGKVGTQQASGKGDEKGNDSGGKGADTVETPKLRAFQVKVQVGQTIGPNVVIKSGITEGEKVIVDGVQAIHEGSEITTSSKAPAAGGKNPKAGN